MAQISTFSDNFNDNSISSSNWPLFGQSSGSGWVTESSQRLNLSFPAGAAPGSYAFITGATGTFSNTSVSAEIVQAIGDLNAYSIFFVFTAETTIYLAVNNGTLLLSVQLPSGSSSSSVPYDPVAHRFWRIRNSGSTMYLDTSPNDETWTNQFSYSGTWTNTNFMVQFKAVVNSTPLTTQTFSIDNFDVQAASRTIMGAASGGGTGAGVSETATVTIASRATGGGHVVTLSQYQAIAQKDYEYRVSTHSGTFVGIWKNVTSDFDYSQSINQAPSELTVSLARSPDNVTVMQEALLDHTGSTILDTNSDPILVQTSTRNAVGAGTDVELNYNVDVYAYYGGYEPLLDTNGDQILDTNSDPILVEFGSPNGKRVYSGYIADYEMTYGKNVGVQVLVVSHATEMNHYVFKSGSNTTVSYSSVDPVQMGRDNMDSYISQGGIITYDSSSMPLSGWTSSYEFNLQTTKEVQDKVVELLPAGYYHYVHPGENKQYLLIKGSTADHTFYYEKHIGELKLKKSLTQLVNEVYYVGGDIGSGVDLFKHYTDATSISTYRPGLDRQSDSRVTLDVSAQVLSQAEINEFKDPRYRTTVTIPDAVYDIESIKLGDMLAFKNFDSFVDNLLLQVATLHRHKHTVDLDLDMYVPTDAKRLEEIKRNILSEAVSSIPVAPT